MADQFDYDLFVARNDGYVSPAAQAKIREKTLLIAGCGIGSSVAVCAARIGFQHFILVDGDVVDPHNLNRQFYEFADIGTPKVDALKDKIMRINPQAQVEALNVFFTAENTEAIVKKADIVFDTVDFLDLDAILSVHTSAKAHNVELFTALSIGFGGGVLYFPPNSGISLADVVAADVQRAQERGEAGYINVFAQVIERIGKHLDVQVVQQIAKALTIMENGKPCPASQVAVGSFTIAALAISMIHDVLEGNPVPCAPNMVIHSFKNHQTKLVNIAG